jgi:ketosteroid isomerase-like protein
MTEIRLDVEAAGFVAETASADERAIERLVRTYADVCDLGYDPDRLAPLFTEDAVWASSSENGTSDFGVYEGNDAIRTFFAGVSSQIVHAHHIVMSPEIDVVVPHERATGRWNTIVAMKLAEDPFRQHEDEAKIMTAVYTHEYRCSDGVWRVARLDVHTQFDLRLRMVG